MFRVFCGAFFLALPLAERGAGDAAYCVLNLSDAGIALLRDSQGSSIVLGVIFDGVSTLAVELKSVGAASKSVYLAVLLILGSLDAVLSFFSSDFLLVYFAVD